MKSSELSRLGIVKATPNEETPRLVFGVHGLEKEGKTSFLVFT